MTTLHRIAPVLPVRDVIRSLEHYRRLGFTVRPYEPAGPDGPFYGFVSSGGGELHLARTRDLDPKANTSARCAAASPLERDEGRAPALFGERKRLNGLMAPPSASSRGEARTPRPARPAPCR